jgi:pentatricopeptide repeat protein
LGSSISLSPLFLFSRAPSFFSHRRHLSLVSILISMPVSLSLSLLYAAAGRAAQARGRIGTREPARRLGHGRRRGVELGELLAAPSGGRRWSTRGSAGAGAQRSVSERAGRIQAGGASMRAAARRSWWCVQVLGGRNRALVRSAALERGALAREQRAAQACGWSCGAGLGTATSGASFPRASGAGAGKRLRHADAAQRWRAGGARRRSCGGGLVREMRERGGVDPDKYTYAMVISGWCKISRIEDVAKVFNKMLAAGEVKPSLRIVSHQTSDFGKHAGGASHSDGSKSEISMIEFIGILNVKVIGGKRRTRDAEDGRWPRREDASELAREMHKGRRAGRRGGEARAATGCDELEGAAVQPGTASSLHPCGGRDRSNTARIRCAA